MRGRGLSGCTKGASIKAYLMSMGDGFLNEMTEAEIQRDLEDGTRDVSERGGVALLSDDDLRHLPDIFRTPAKFTSVGIGDGVVLTYDAGMLKTRRVGIDVRKIDALQIYDKLLGADTMELTHVDYNFKSVKPIVGNEQPFLEQALLSTTIPLSYGAMPNLEI